MNILCEIIKLNGRYTGYPRFTHYVTSPPLRFGTNVWNKFTSIENYNKLRDRCWETWGPSCDLRDYLFLGSNDRVVNEYWAWHVKDHIRRIYLTEKGKVWYDLAWS